MAQYGTSALVAYRVRPGRTYRGLTPNTNKAFQGIASQELSLTMMSLQDLYKALSLLATAIALVMAHHAPGDAGRQQDELVPLESVGSEQQLSTTPSEAPTQAAPTLQTVRPTARITPPTQTPDVGSTPEEGTVPDVGSAPGGADEEDNEGSGVPEGGAIEVDSPNSGEGDSDAGDHGGEGEGNDGDQADTPSPAAPTPTPTEGDAEEGNEEGNEEEGTETEQTEPPADAPAPGAPPTDVAPIAAAPGEETSVDPETPADPATSSEDTAVWDQLAECESSGNWSSTSNSTYDGGLQFHPDTWNAYGGDQYAPTADQASKEEQIAVAEKLRDQEGGYSAWPACSQKLGLPQ